MDDEERLQVGIGCYVVVELVDEQGNGEELAFDLVPEQNADFGRGLVSAESALGAAVRGKFVGDEVDYGMGDIHHLHITYVGPSQLDSAPDAQARRQEILDEARRKAERTNADMFASSFSGKWGDYNTDEIDR